MWCAVVWCCDVWFDGVRCYCLMYDLLVWLCDCVIALCVMLWCDIVWCVVVWCYVMCNCMLLFDVWFDGVNVWLSDCVVCDVVMWCDIVWCVMYDDVMCSCVMLWCVIWWCEVLLFDVWFVGVRCDRRCSSYSASGIRTWLDTNRFPGVIVRHLLHGLLSSVRPIIPEVLSLCPHGRRARMLDRISSCGLL